MTEGVLSGLKSSGLTQQESNGKALSILIIIAFLLSSAVCIFLPIVLSEGHPARLFHLPKQNIPRTLYYRLAAGREFSREGKRKDYTGIGTKPHYDSPLLQASHFGLL